MDTTADALTTGRTEVGSAMGKLIVISASMSMSMGIDTITSGPATDGVATGLAMLLAMSVTAGTDVWPRTREAKKRGVSPTALILLIFSPGVQGVSREAPYEAGTMMLN